MLVLSVLALFAGPLVYHLLRARAGLTRALDRVVAVVLIALVGAVLVPEVWPPLGPVALALVLAGYLVPLVLEFSVRRVASAFHAVALGLAVLGLALHALLDGAGLGVSDLGHATGLGVAIVVHRVGVGLTLWFLLQPLAGAAWALGTLVAMAALTVAGYFGAEALVPLAGARATLVVQALIVGTIIHSLVHRGHLHAHAH